MGPWLRYVSLVVAPKEKFRFGSPAASLQSATPGGG